jgi:glyoxylase-like metal-dependent hydrolase (beta-lactamase superfamily II)
MDFKSMEDYFREEVYELELNDLGIIPIRIPLPFRLNHVNAYLAQGSDGWTILDTGLGYDVTKETWLKVFEEHGLNAEEVTKIYITHFHPDHYGFCGELQQWTGAKVYMSRRTLEYVERTWTEDEFAKAKQNYTRCGIPDDLVDQVDHLSRRFMEWVSPHARANEFIEEGDKLEFGTLTYEAVHTPGHADGHMSLVNKDGGVWIAGDHLLSKITPNITYSFSEQENPLKDYMDSLIRLKAYDFQYVIPGHGSPFTHANQRIDEVLTHHEERLQRVLDSLKGSRKNPYEVCSDLFNKRLNEHEMRFAIGEALAHLQYLVKEGKVQQGEADGILYYESEK